MWLFSCWSGAKLPRTVEHLNNAADAPCLLSLGGGGAAKFTGTIACRARVSFGAEGSHVLFLGPASGGARRPAEDFRRRHALVTHPATRPVLECGNVDAFRFEDAHLLLRTAEAVVADLAVAAHDAVARNQNRHWVVRERASNGTHRLRPTDLARDPVVRPYLTAWNLERFA